MHCMNCGQKITTEDIEICAICGKETGHITPKTMRQKVLSKERAMQEEKQRIQNQMIDRLSDTSEDWERKMEYIYEPMDLLDGIISEYTQKITEDYPDYTPVYKVDDALVNSISDNNKKQIFLDSPNVEITDISNKKTNDISKPKLQDNNISNTNVVDDDDDDDDVPSTIIIKNENTTPIIEEEKKSILDVPHLYVVSSEHEKSDDSNTPTPPVEKTQSAKEVIDQRVEKIQETQEALEKEKEKASKHIDNDVKEYIPQKISNNPQDNQVQPQPQQNLYPQVNQVQQLPQQNLYPQANQVQQLPQQNLYPQANQVQQQPQQNLYPQVNQVQQQPQQNLYPQVSQVQQQPQQNLYPQVNQVQQLPQQNLYPQINQVQQQPQQNLYPQVNQVQQQSQQNLYPQINQVQQQPQNMPLPQVNQAQQQPQNMPLPQVNQAQQQPQNMPLPQVNQAQQLPQNQNDNVTQAQQSFPNMPPQQNQDFPNMPPQQNLEFPNMPPQQNKEFPNMPPQQNQDFPNMPPQQNKVDAQPIPNNMPQPLYNDVDSDFNNKSPKNQSSFKVFMLSLLSFGTLFAICIGIFMLIPRDFKIQNGVLVEYTGRDKIVHIPTNVVRIDDSVFENLSFIEEIIIPESVTSIGDLAFANSTNLSKLEFHNNLEHFGKNAVYGVPLFSDFTFDGSTLIEYNGSDTNVVIPDFVTTIGTQVFFDNDIIETIKLPSNLRVIEEVAFSSCDNIQSITIPNGTTTIYNSAFSGCDSLLEIIIPTSVTFIGSDAFSGTNWYKNLADEFNIVGYNILIKYLGKNEDVNIPENVTMIGNAAFRNNQDIKSVTIPSTVKEIGYQAFSGCSFLENVVINEGTTTISEGAFLGCISLTKMQFPTTITSVKRMALRSTTWYQNFYDKFGIIGDGTLIRYLGDDSELIIPNDVLRISDEAFSEAYLITKINFHNNIVYMDKNAFVELPNLIEIVCTQDSYVDKFFKENDSLSHITISYQ